MTDAGTRQRMALMRMVQNKAATSPGDSVSVTRMTRHLPEIDHKIRQAVESRDVGKLQEILLKLGCTAERREKVWPLLCGVVSADDGSEFVRQLVEDDYKDLVECARGLGYLSSEGAELPLSTPSVPYSERATPLPPSEGKKAKDAGQCYFCGAARHYLRECPQYFAHTALRQEQVLRVAFLDDYLASFFSAGNGRVGGADGRCWLLPPQDPVVTGRHAPAFDDEDLILWLRAMAFRFFEAIPQNAVTYRIMKRITKEGSEPWAQRVRRQASTLADVLVGELRQQGRNHAQDICPLQLSEAMSLVVSPMLGSLMALSSHKTFMPNDTVLRVWDAVVWQRDPLSAVANLVRELLQPLPARISSCHTWTGVTEAAQSCLQAFSSWADERQRLALIRSCET
ncbi:hypothetical protein DIPPA_03809 [Diplonema papillatum]|nr:hypothetical protein DIPPA_03809 [Diplonema papillatum]